MINQNARSRGKVTAGAPMAALLPTENTTMGGCQWCSWRPVVGIDDAEGQPEPLDEHMHTNTYEEADDFSDSIYIDAYSCVYV